MMPTAANVQVWAAVCPRGCPRNFALIFQFTGIALIVRHNQEKSDEKQGSGRRDKGLLKDEKRETRPRFA